MADESSLEQRIRERAYQIWLAEGQPHGRDKAHWAAARAAIAAEEHKKQRDAQAHRAQSAPAESGESGGEPCERCEDRALFPPWFAFWPRARWP